MGDVYGEVTHYHVVVFDSLLIRDDFDVADCTAETLVVENVVYLGWVTTGAVCDQVHDSLLESGVADTETIGYGEFQYTFTCCVTGTEAMSTMGIRLNTPAEVPTWLF